MPKRAKVRLEFPEKLFYEKVLVDWKESVPDKNHAYVIRKALDNLRLFPIDVSGYAELRKIKGIGENIATRLEAAWRKACGTHFSSDSPTIEEVRALKRGEVLPFLELAVVSKGRHDVPFLPRKRTAAAVPLSQTDSSPSKTAQGTSGSRQTGTASTLNTIGRLTQSQPTGGDVRPLLSFAAGSSRQDRLHTLTEEDYSDDNNNTSFSQPTHPTFHGERGLYQFSSQIDMNERGLGQPTVVQSDERVGSLESATNTNSMASQRSAIQQAPSSSGEISGTQLSSIHTQSESQTDTLLFYDPSKCHNYDLILIVDGRETATAKGRQRIPITQHLEKLGIRQEMRPLSVGDYLWVVRPALSTNPREEMIMDYVVERKTWDDLKSSIRQTRYHEQKRRLRESGIRNVIVVAEGAPTSDRSLQQALASTSVDNRFLIHRTLSIQGTAKFLKTLTDRLAQRMKTEHICGPSFSTLQDNSRKTKLLTVRDCWLRQLTVCPMMSAERANLLAGHFPTLRSMASFYRQKVEESKKKMKDNNAVVDLKMMLHDEIGDIPKSLSAQFSMFVEADCLNYT